MTSITPKTAMVASLEHAIPWHLIKEAGEGAGLLALVASITFSCVLLIKLRREPT